MLTLTHRVCGHWQFLNSRSLYALNWPGKILAASCPSSWQQSRAQVVSLARTSVPPAEFPGAPQGPKQADCSPEEGVG